MVLQREIIHGSHPSNVSHRWTLLGLLEEFNSLLQPHLTLIPSHVKRDANKIIYFLANKWVYSKGELIQWNTQTSQQTMLLDCCLDLSRRDYPTPYGVTSSRRRPRNTPINQSINMSSLHPSPQSWMEGNINKLQRKVGHLPHISLMAFLWINDRIWMLNTGGCIAVMSSPLIYILLILGLEYFISAPCHIPRPSN